MPIGLMLVLWLDDEIATGMAAKPLDDGYERWGVANHKPRVPRYTG